jgi:hypothetical protein
MAAPDAAFQSAVGENIRLRNRTCQEQGIVQRQRMTEGMEADPARALGYRREHRQRVRRDAKLLEKMMFDHRIGIESYGIRMLDLAHDLPGQLGMWLIQWRLHFRIDSETHGWSPQLLSAPYTGCSSPRLCPPSCRAVGRVFPGHFWHTNPMTRQLAWKSRQYASP